MVSGSLTLCEAQTVQRLADAVEVLTKLAQVVLSRCGEATSRGDVARALNCIAACRGYSVTELAVEHFFSQTCRYTRGDPCPTPQLVRQTRQHPF